MNLGGAVEGALGACTGRLLPTERSVGCPANQLIDKEVP
jgi:hypothetical protein